MLKSLLARKRNGQITSTVSSWQPTKEEKEATTQVMQDYEHGKLIFDKTYVEFNNRSLVQEIDANQKSFNTYLPPKSDDPDDSWRAQTTKPIVRNKLISIAAHVTATILYPTIFAQNRNQEEDKDAASVMQDCMQWVMENSNYERSFLNGIISALVNPAVIMETGFMKVMRRVKEMKEGGGYTQKEIVDEVLSGFFTNVVPVKELLIANIYENNIQKQRFLIRRKLVDFREAKTVWGNKPNFQYVKAGVMAIFDEATDTFYDCPSEDLKDTLVEEVTYYNRYDDLQLTFINGVLMCDPEYPLQRKDKMYPFAKNGFEPLNDGHFFYYKSAANKLGPDEELVNLLYNYVLDGTFLSLMPPLALYGDEEIGSSVMVPGTITSLRQDTKLDTIGPRSDLRAGLEAITLVERSVAESSQDSFRSGISQVSGERTAYEISLLEQNAKIALGLFGKSVGFLVEDLGRLQVGDILQYLTMPEIDAITGVEDPLKYKSLLLPEQILDGKKVTKKLRFSEKYITDEDQITEKEKMDRSYEVLQEEGDLDSEDRIYIINPKIFRELKYRIVVKADKLGPRNKSLEKALNLEGYDRMIRDPFADQEAVARDFLYETYKPGESGKYMRKGGPDEGRAQALIGGKGNTGGVNQNMTGQLTGSNSLRNALTQGEQ